MGIENVIKKIHVEPINRKAEYEAAGFLTREEVTAAMDQIPFFSHQEPDIRSHRQHRMDGRILDRTSVAVLRVHRRRCI